MNKQSQDDSDIIVPYDGGDIWVKRMASQTIGNNGQMTLAIHSCSGLKTNVQRSVYRHSPTGFNYGYGGSGPADLALNILRMFTTPEKADRMYQDFKWKFIGSSKDGTTNNDHELIIPREKILEFIAHSELV